MSGINRLDRLKENKRKEQRRKWNKNYLRRKKMFGKKKIENKNVAQQKEQSIDLPPQAAEMSEEEKALLLLVRNISFFNKVHTPQGMASLPSSEKESLLQNKVFAVWAELTQIRNEQEAYLKAILEELKKLNLSVASDAQGQAYTPEEAKTIY